MLPVSLVLISQTVLAVDNASLVGCVRASMNVCFWIAPLKVMSSVNVKMGFTATKPPRNAYPVPLVVQMMEALKKNAKMMEVK